MSIQNGTSLTKEALEYLVGLIRDISGLDSKLIDDININNAFSVSSDRMKRTFCGQFIDKDSKGYEKRITKMVDLFEQTDIKYNEAPFFY